MYSYGRVFPKICAAGVRLGYRTLRTLVGLIESRDENLRRNAVSALVGAGPFASPVIEDLVRFANRYDNSTPQKKLIVSLLSSMGVTGADGVPVLINAALDPQFSDQIGAAAGVRRTGLQGAQIALPLLLHKLNDPSPRVRKDAQFVLFQLGPNAILALPSLIALTPNQPLEGPFQSALLSIGSENERFRRAFGSAKTEPQTNPVAAARSAELSKQLIEKLYRVNAQAQLSDSPEPLNRRYWWSRVLPLEEDNPRSVVVSYLPPRTIVYSESYPKLFADQSVETDRYLSQFALDSRQQSYSTVLGGVKVIPFQRSQTAYLRASIVQPYQVVLSAELKRDDGDLAVYEIYNLSDGAKVGYPTQAIYSGERLLKLLEEIDRALPAGGLPSPENFLPAMARTTFDGFIGLGLLPFVAVALAIALLIVVLSRRPPSSNRRIPAVHPHWTDDPVILSMFVVGICAAGAGATLIYGWMNPCADYVPKTMLDSACSFDPGRTLAVWGLAAATFIIGILRIAANRKGRDIAVEAYESFQKRDSESGEEGIKQVRRTTKPIIDVRPSLLSSRPFFYIAALHLAATFGFRIAQIAYALNPAVYPYEGVIQILHFPLLTIAPFLPRAVRALFDGTHGGMILNSIVAAACIAWLFRRPADRV